METPKGYRYASIFDLTGRVAVITGGNGGIGLGIAQALSPKPAATSRSGAATPTRTRAPRATMAGRHRQGRLTPRLRCQRSRFGQGRDGRPRSTPSAGSTAALPMPASAAADGTPSSTAPRKNGAACSRTNLDGVFSRVPGRRAPHDRARRRPATRSAGWSRPRAWRRCSAPRATSIMPRPRPRMNALVPRARRRTGALRHPRELDFSRLDRDRHDGRRTEQPRPVQRKGYSARAGPPLGRAFGLRRHRGVSRQRCVRLSHRRKPS